MEPVTGLGGHGRIARHAALLLFALLTHLPAPARAAHICAICVQSENDTASSTGIVATSRIALNPAIAPHVAFVGADHRLRCAMPAFPGWQIETVDPLADAGGCSLELDSLASPMISYHDANGMLFWARRLATGWLAEPVDPASIVTGTTSITRVPGGVGIAYQDGATGMLRYAERIGAEPWTLDFVTPAGEVGAFPSLVAEGPVRAISYFDVARGDLRLAQRQAGAPWTSAVVDSAGNVGGYTSLIGKPSLGGFGIAYYDFTNADLKYAYMIPGGGWSIETVDGAGAQVGRYCSAAALTGMAGDLVGIGYYDETNGDLEYALKQGPAWTRNVQDAAGDVGAPVACGTSADPSDTIGIAYADRNTHDLLYLWHAGAVTAAPERIAPPTSPSVEWLPAPGGAGGRVRFTVPDAGEVRVAFYDAAGRRIAAPLRRWLPTGTAEVRWDGRDALGHRVPAGMLFVRVETTTGAAAVPAIVLR